MKASLLNKNFGYAFPILTLTAMTFIMIGSTTLYAQPEVGWERVIGGRQGADLLEGIVLTTDNQYAVAGRSSTGEGIYTFWLALIDRDGETIWQQIYETEGNHAYCHDLVQTQDNGFLLVGEELRDGSSVWFVIRTDADGDEIWRRYYFEDNTGIAWSVVALSGDNYAIAGMAFYDDGQGQQGQILQIDGNGDGVWQQNYGGDNTDRLFDIIQYRDGFAVCGLSQEPGDWNGWLIRVDDDGDVVWEERYDLDNLGVEANGLIENSDGWIAMTGESTTDNFSTTDVILAVYNENGEFQFDGSYDVTQRDVSFALIQNTDESYTLIGQKYLNQMNRACQAVGVDREGNLLWDRAGGNPSMFTSFNDALLDPIDHSTMICGSTYVREGNTFEGLLVKLLTINHPPVINAFWPEDTIIFLPVDIDTAFRVEALDVDGDEVSYYWILDADTISREDLIFFNPQDTGHFELRCFVTDSVFTVSVGWEIFVFRILTGFEPQETTIQADQNDSISFNLFLGLPLDSVSIYWTFDTTSWSDGLSQTISFPDTGSHIVTGLASWREFREGVAWTVVVDPVNSITESSIPDVPGLVSLFPNPFNNLTTLRFALSQPEIVKLTLHDLQGRRVLSLLNEMRLAGVQTIIINGTELPAGVYLVRLETKQGVKMQKVVLVR